MARITLASLDKTEVELFGHVYTIRPATKAVVTKANEVEKAMEAADDADALVAAQAAALDIRLAPTAEKQPKASTVLRKAWNEDKVTLAQILALMADVVEADRPI